MANLQSVYEKLVHANGPEDIYGPLSGSTESEMLQGLKKLHHYLIKVVHPDKCGNTKDEYMANEATSTLMKLYNEAMDKIRLGVYGDVKPASAFTAPYSLYKFEIHGKKFNISAKIEATDLCNIFEGECEHSNGSVEPVVFKIPLDPANNDLMKNEAAVLKKVAHESSTVLVTSCELKDTGSMVNVLKKIEGAYHFEQVRAKYPDGLPQEHVAWVLDRMLDVLGFFHTNYVIHAGIKPKNLLLVPHNHNGILSDFSLSVYDANEVGKKYKGKNSFTAPEVTKDTVPHPTADIYSLGKSIIYLAGGEVDDLVYLPSSMDMRLKRFLGKMVMPDPNDRASDCWEEWHELKRLRKEIFGAESQFLPLNM